MTAPLQRDVSDPKQQRRYPQTMCRSIKTLRRADEPATDEEVRAAALQFVRKVSGYREPSRKNTDAFNEAVASIAEASTKLLNAVAAPVRESQAD